MKKISVDDIARSTYLSTTYITKIYKEVTGDTPINYLINLRLEKARDILEEGHFSIQAVAKKVGYDDPYYFSKLFKKKFGCSPSSYKRKGDRDQQHKEDSMSFFIQPTVPYHSSLDIRQTEIAIKQLKDFFQVALAKKLRLTRVTAPLFVCPETGLNDNLNGIERPVSFDVMETGRVMEIVHSLCQMETARAEAVRV